MMSVPHKLLLADDSVTIQRVIELTFADEDVQVIAVGNGQDAIDRVQRDPPDIVLADAGMPERDGYEVAAFIKGQPAFSHIPVVLLTGAFEPVDEARAKSVGCDGILVKPFEPQIVISRVKDLLAGRRPSGMWSAAPPQQPPARLAAPASADPARGRPAANGDSLEAYFDHLDAAFSGTGGTGPAASAAPVATPAARRDPIPLARRQEAVDSKAGDSSQNKSATRDPFADWDPDLSGDPTRPAVIVPPIAFPQRVAAPEPRPETTGPVAAPPTQMPPLSSAPPATAPVPVAPVPVSVAPAPAPAAPAAAAPAAAAWAPAAPAPSSAPSRSQPAAVLPTSLVDAFAALLAAEQRMNIAPSAATVPPTSSAPAGAEGGPTDELVEEVSRRVLARLSEQSRPAVLDVAERLVREEIERIKHSGNL